MPDAEPYHGLPTLRIERSNDRVYESLRDAITDGVLAPGHRLIEARLAARLGVSRAPVREAIRVLEREGLVRTVPRRGATVALMARQDVREIYGLRAALESWAVRTVTESRPADLDELSRPIEEMRSASHRKDVELLSGEDVRFHSRICELAGNERLLQVWLGIVGQIRLLSRQVIGTLYEDLGEVPTRHEAILAAIRSGDADAAVEVVRDHICSVADRILLVFPESEPSVGARRLNPFGPEVNIERGVHARG